jgi:predicted membrane GTPase involved in stress response
LPYKTGSQMDKIRNIAIIAHVDHARELAAAKIDTAYKKP